MSRRHLTVLVIATIALAVVAAAIAFINRPQQGSVLGGRLYPELAAQLNDVEKVEAQTAGEDLTTLALKDKRWVVTNRWDYPADTSELRQNLLILARLELVEEKTSDPDNYAVLGVQPIDEAKEDTQLLRLTGNNGTELAEVLIGKTGTGSGNFVRRADEKTTWLASAYLRLPKTTEEWLARDLFDVEETRILRIRMQPAGGEAYVLEKQTPDAKTFTLKPTPAGKIANSSELQRVVRVFKGMRLDDVMPNSEADKASAPWTTFRVEALDGLVIDGQIRRVDDAHQLRFTSNYQEPEVTASAEPPAAAEPEPTSDSEKSAADPAVAAESKTPEAKPQVDAAAARKETERLNALAEGWTYVIAPYRGEPLLLTLDRLVAAPEKEDGLSP